MVRNFPSKELLTEFSSLAMPLAISPTNSNSSQVPSWEFNDKELVINLTKHKVYEFLIKHKLFQDALKWFKRTNYYKQYKSKVCNTDIFDDDISFLLMRIISSCGLFYLDERDKKIIGTVTKKNRANIIKVFEEAEKCINVVKLSFFCADTANLEAELHKIKNFVQSASSVFSERNRHDPIAKMLVQRISRFYYINFRELSQVVIRNMANIFLLQDDYEFANELFKTWVNDSLNDQDILNIKDFTTIGMPAKNKPENLNKMYYSTWPVGITIKYTNF